MVHVTAEEAAAAVVCCVGLTRDDGRALTQRASIKRNNAPSLRNQLLKDEEKMRPLCDFP